MKDMLNLVIVIILGIIFLNMVIGIIAGNIYDKQKPKINFPFDDILMLYGKKNIHYIHNAFAVFGIFSFSKKIRHKYIYDKCF